MKHYYSEDGITIYNARCEEILPHLAPVDLVLTDPPYGIGEARGKNKSRSCLAVSRDYGSHCWDDKPPSHWVISLLLEISKYQIIFGGNYYELPPSSCWLVWDKLNGENDFADCELAWTNLPKAVRRIQWRWHGMLREGNEQRLHPTQKPLAVIKWALSQAPEDCASVLDPFMGSGTTLLAARDRGRQCIGVEQSKEYCDIAIERLRQQVLFAPEPQPQPEQESLL